MGLFLRDSVRFQVDGKAKKAAETMCNVIGACALVLAFMLAGAAILSVFELDAENAAVAEAVADMLAFKARYNVTDADFADLCSTAGTPIEQAAGGSWVESSDRNWKFE